jgi:signal transduction histidine kinase
MKYPLWRGSTLQSIAIIVIPLTLLLVLVSLGSFWIHQNAMRSLVGERDERSVLTAASAIASEIDHRVAAIRSLTMFASSNPSENPVTILSKGESLMGDFDYGSAFFDPNGSLMAASGAQAFWQSLTAGGELASALNPSADTAISAVFANKTDGKPVVLVSSKMPNSNLVAIGAFSPETLLRRSLQDIYPPGGQVAITVISSPDQVLFQSGATSLEGNTARHPGVSEAFSGKSGATYVRVGNDEHVVTYSPVPRVGWAIVTEESWETVSSPTLRASQMIPLVLVPALLLALLALWFGGRQIVQPLQSLEARAAKLTWGNFKEIEEPVGGIAEIRHLQNELVHMARQLQAAQQSLHSYIGAITQGQEEERRRLARDLHDDTIQALIALKQRVELARPGWQKGSASLPLEELESLIEQTIENLRRTIRALRPIYLEDLGLVTALEVLAGETSQSSGLAVDFHTSGTERRLPAEVELALYRMAQEGFNNVIRHAQALHASARLEFSAQGVRLDILDDGVGFEIPKTPAEYTPQGHFGLLGLYERVELIGARLEINSTKGKGTHLSILFPTPQEPLIPDQHHPDGIPGSSHE